MSDECAENVDLSIARCIVNGIATITITLVKQHSEVLSFEETVADDVDGQILYDDEVEEVSIRLVSV